jgi:L-gulonate 3-dehydrogenase
MDAAQASYVTSLINDRGPVINDGYDKSRSSNDPLSDMNIEGTRRPVACVGVGTVGRAWAATFAASGREVRLFDHSRSVCETAVAWVTEALASFESSGLISSSREACARVSISLDLTTALAQTEYVQESVPEDLATKRAVFSELDRWANPETILASSTSELPGRLFMSHISGRARCLVAHPINPPHLIPLVEVSPTPWTSASALENCLGFLRAVGQEPVHVKKEISGFLVNRLQMALIGEALHLVGEGYCSAEDLDKTVRSGLGLRWAFMGPFETGHLNAPGGYLDYMTKFKPSMQKLLGELKVNQPLDDELIRRIDTACQLVTPKGEVAQRQKWRDDQLIRLRKHFAGLRSTSKQ